MEEQCHLPVQNSDTLIVETNQVKLLSSMLIATLATVVIWSAKDQQCAFAEKRGDQAELKAQLRKAQTEIARNPDSAFWHNQAGLAYDALGDVKNAVKELTLASKLDPTNPIDDYMLYAVYKRKGTLVQQRKTLLEALEKDRANPLGHFELGVVLERERYWEESLREYRTARELVMKVKESVYIDPRGNPYEIGVVRKEVDGYINRVMKLAAPQHRER